MFNNIGKKIKGLAKFLFWVVVIAAIIGGFLVILQGIGNSHSSSGEKIGAVIGGLLVIGLGIVFAWLQNFLLYGYGELIDCSQKMLRILEDNNKNSNNNMYSNNYAKTTVVQQPVKESISQPTLYAESKQTLQSVVEQNHELVQEDNN